MDISIRPVERSVDLKKIEDIQREVWQAGDLQVIPARTLHAIAYNGGMLLGAYDAEEVVGFIFAVIGTVQGLDKRVDQVAAARLQLYSTIMGVLPGYQGQGIGYRLKLAQREFAIRMGIRLVTWTYDPLESRNAWLNIGKLGAVCRQYLLNFHGNVGGINAGLDTDRFYVEWWVTGNRVQSRVDRQRRPLGYEQLIAGRARLINEASIEASIDDSALPAPPAGFVESDASLVLVEIPADIQTVKQADMDLARAWRAHTRDVFQHYFDNQYIVTDFTRREDAEGHTRCYYVLTYQHA